MQSDNHQACSSAPQQSPRFAFPHVERLPSKLSQRFIAGDGFVGKERLRPAPSSRNRKTTSSAKGEKRCIIVNTTAQTYPANHNDENAVLMSEKPLVVAKHSEAYSIDRALRNSNRPVVSIMEGRSVDYLVPEPSAMLTENGGHQTADCANQEPADGGVQSSGAGTKARSEQAKRPTAANERTGSSASEARCGTEDRPLVPSSQPRNASGRHVAIEVVQDSLQNDVSCSPHAKLTHGNTNIRFASTTYHSVAMNM